MINNKKIFTVSNKIKDMYFNINSSLHIILTNNSSLNLFTESNSNPFQLLIQYTRLLIHILIKVKQLYNFFFSKDILFSWILVNIIDLI